MEMETWDTPRVEDCLRSVMAKHHGISERALGRYFEEAIQHLAPLARELERENAMLRQGDTCARQCEGTAYRIEARRLRAALQRLTTAIGELPDWESDELHKAYTEAMALMTPNGQVQRDAACGGSAGTQGSTS